MPKKVDPKVLEDSITEVNEELRTKLSEIESKVNEAMAEQRQLVLERNSKQGEREGLEKLVEKKIISNKEREEDEKEIITEINELQEKINNLGNNLQAYQNEANNVLANAQGQVRVFQKILDSLTEA
mgnify:CR=1 FL=1